jgi:hypothetical protein
MADEIVIKSIVAAPRDKWVHLGIETHDGHRFVAVLSAREHAAILGSLIRAGLDCEQSALQPAATKDAFRAALLALEGNDKSPSERIN